MTNVAKGSRVKLKFSDGSYVEWTAEQDVNLDRAILTLERLARLDPRTGTNS